MSGGNHLIAWSHATCQKRKLKSCGAGRDANGALGPDICGEVAFELRDLLSQNEISSIQDPLDRDLYFVLDRRVLSFQINQWYSHLSIIPFLAVWLPIDTRRGRRYC